MDQQTLNGLVIKHRTSDVISANFDELFDHFVGEMPYGTAKAIDGDPYEWLNAKLTAILHETDSTRLIYLYDFDDGPAIQ